MKGILIINKVSNILTLDQGTKSVEKEERSVWSQDHRKKETLLSIEDE